MNHLALASCGISYADQEASLRVTSDPLSDRIHVVVMLSGRAEFTVDARRIVAERNMAFVSSPARPATMLAEGPAEALIVTFDVARVEQELSRQLQRPVTHALTLAPGWPATQGLAAFIRMAVTLCEEAERSDSLVVQSPLACAGLEHTLLMLLLEQHEHSFSAELRGEDAAGVASWQVRMAEQYMLANLDRPITMGDVSDEVGVSVRRLTLAFRHARGGLPRAFLMRARLERVREALLQGNVRSIGKLATTWGFFHLGRFSELYRKEYGERPSETLHRRVRWIRGVPPSSSSGPPAPVTNGGH